LRVEQLEPRQLLSVSPLLIVETENNDTLDIAQNLGNLNTAGLIDFQGTIGNSPVGAADVDWTSFTLTEAAKVTLTARAAPGSSPVGILSLFNSDPFDFGDPYDPLGHRLLAQGSTLDRELGPGTYYVAVSGEGNLDFNPFLGGSGHPGSTGNYDVQFAAVSLGPNSNNGPTVLAADPGPAAILGNSPLILRVDLSSALDPGTVQLGENVHLTFNPAGTFGSGQDQDVPFAGFNLSTDGTELQLLMQAPLGPGYYKLDLAGDGSSGVPVLADPNGLALGTTADNPQGQDFSMTFQVAGIKDLGQTTSIDTIATADNLGNLINTGIRLTGAIGNDSTDPIRFNPGNVDIYSFTITGAGRFALTAEVDAQRIGSPLDAGLSLFEVGADQQVHLIASNDNSLNATPATNGTIPLFSDPVLFTGLTAGTYYLAVSGSGNVPDPAAGLYPGVNGVFDPEISHSGQAGFSTGPYVLDLGVQADNVPPQVIATSIATGAVLNSPPTQLTVQFSEDVNLTQLALNAYEQTGQSNIDSVYIQGTDGARYYPRLTSWESTTHQATFLMLDGLPNGDYQLHLSGTLGLTDLAGNPLVGNDPSGDYVVSFSVNGPPRGSNGDPLTWIDAGFNHSLVHAQSLGVLFPHELQFGAGVTIERDPASPGVHGFGGQADYYQFSVLQNRPYTVTLDAPSLSGFASIQLLNEDGTPVPAATNDTGDALKAVLDPGTYVIEVRGWRASQARSVSYQLNVTLDGAGENPVPLTTGPSPALFIRFTNSSTATTPSSGASPSSPVVAGGSPSTATSNSSSLGEVPPGTFLSLGTGPIGGAGSSGAVSIPRSTVATLGQDLRSARSTVQAAVSLPNGSSPVTEIPVVMSSGTSEPIIDSSDGDSTESASAVPNTLPPANSRQTRVAQEIINQPMVKVPAIQRVPAASVPESPEPNSPEETAEPDLLQYGWVAATAALTTYTAVRVNGSRSRKRSPNG
jgi:hypothetical protein